jgi:hypothetical protein
LAECDLAEVNRDEAQAYAPLSVGLPA